MVNSVSKDAFVASLNLSAATGQTDTKITAAAAYSSISGTLDLTNSANYGKVRFAISVDAVRPLKLIYETELFLLLALLIQLVGFPNAGNSGFGC